MEWIASGGMAMMPLLAVSVYVLAVVLYKSLEIVNGKMLHHGFVPEVVGLVKNGQVTRAQEVLRYQPGPLAKVLAELLEAFRNPALTQEGREQEALRLGSHELRRAEAHLKGLDMAANIATLLGLLGTVLGMMSSFAGIEQAGARVNPSLLAGGIREAWIATATGLAIAVPATVAFYGFQAAAEKLRHLLSDACTQILHAYPAPGQAAEAKPAAQPGAAQPGAAQPGAAQPIAVTLPAAAPAPETVKASPAPAPAPFEKKPFTFSPGAEVAKAEVKAASPATAEEAKPAKDKSATGRTTPRKTFANKNSGF